MTVRIALFGDGGSVSVSSPVSQDRAERLRWRILQAVRRAGEDMAVRVVRAVEFEQTEVRWDLFEKEREER